MRWLVLVLAVAGCGGGNAAPVDAALMPASDAAVTDAGVGQPDLAPIVGIACGGTPCAANAQFCCTSDRGLTGMCGFGNQAGECSGARFYCDGPEDCPPAESHCCFSNGTATCGAAECPNTEAGGLGLCHHNPDCASTRQCCSSATSPYKLCLQIGCGST